MPFEILWKVCGYSLEENVWQNVGYPNYPLIKSVYFWNEMNPLDQYTTEPQSRSHFAFRRCQRLDVLKSHHLDVNKFFLI